MKMTIWGLLVLMPLSQIAQAQERGISSLAIQTGYHHIARQDQLFSPMIHRGSSLPNIRLEYAVECAAWRHAAALGYFGYSAGFADPFTFTDPIDDQERQSARSGYTFMELDHRSEKLVRDSSGTRVWLGGSLAGQLGAFDHGYAYPTFGYTIFFGLGASARLEHDLTERTTLVADLAVPLVAWLARSPYMLNDDEFIENQSSHRTFRTLRAFVGDGDLVSFGSFRRAHLRAGVEHQVAPRWRIGGQYSLEYLDISTPLRLISYRNGLDLSIRFNLRKA